MNKKTVKTTLILLISVLLLIVSTSCEKENEQTLPGMEKTEKVSENKIYLHMDLIRSLNPIVSKDRDTYYISKLVYDSLFECDKSFTPKPVLVENYNFDRKAGKLDIRLKNDIKWQRANDVLNSRDVEFTIEAIRYAGIKSPYFDQVNTIQSVVTKGDLDLTITFKDNHNMNIANLTFPVIRKRDFFDPYVIQYLDEKFRLNGTGPYKCYRKSVANNLTLRPFRKYHGGRVKSRIKFSVLQDISMLNRLLESGNLSLGLNEKRDRATKISKKGIKIKNFPSNKLVFLGFNTKKESLMKPQVRSAIARAIDIKSIITDSYYGCAMPSNSLYVPGFMDGSKAKSSYEYDLDESEKLLKKQGIKDIDEDGILEDEKGGNFTLNIVVQDVKKTRIRAAEIIKADLEDLGFQVYISVLPKKNYEVALRKGAFDMYLGGANVDHTMDFRFLLATGGEYNFVGYEDAEMDNLLNQLYSGLSEADSRKILKKIKKKLKKDVPYYCISYETYGIVKSLGVKGQIKPSFFNIYKGAETWYSEYEVPVNK